MRMSKGLKNRKTQSLFLIMSVVLLTGCGSSVPEATAAASESEISESEAPEGDVSESEASEGEDRESDVSESEAPEGEDRENEITDSATISSIESGDMDSYVDGGWEICSDVSSSLTDEDAAVFSQAVEKLAGMVYQPACVMATRNGDEKEYSFLCTEAVRTRPEAAAWRILLVSQAEGENAKVTGIMPVDISNLHVAEENIGVPLLTDWEVPEAPASSLPKEADEAFQIAEKENDQPLSPVVLLGTQVVAGMNYRILCIGKDDHFTSRNALYAATIYRDLQGSASFTEIAKLDLTDYTKMVCQPMNP